jgi:AraC-like DNA-binding protein
MKKKLSITDMLAQDVVISMAKALNVPVENTNSEYRINLPEEFGVGIVKAHTFDDGFGVVETDYVLKKDFHFELEKGQVHPLKIIFNMGDTFYHKLESDGEFMPVNFSETVVVASTPKNNHRFLIPKATDSRIFTLEVNRKLFERKVGNYSSDMESDIEDLFRDVNGVLPFSYKAIYSYDIATLIRDFKSIKLTGLKKNLYLESKAYEILVNFLEQHNEDKGHPDKRNIFRQNHIKLIQNAANDLRAHLDNPIKVADLAKKHGLNTTIIQNGFRTIYGMSVNEFLQNERLNEIKRLLEETNLSISQIVYEVGLNSKSYLSKIFLERFGITPTQYRVNAKNSKNG